jgi:glycosyltransferase involved in cell wall biosynthesis
MPAAMSTESAPKFSVIVAVYNDWGPLEECLRCLDGQQNARDVEVIIVDDGSVETASKSVRKAGTRLRLTIIRQPHAGISAARNAGLRHARGSVLVFTDADCRFQPNSLVALDAVVSAFPQHSSFQLRLAGDDSTLVGRAEDLRLIALQDRMLQPTGCIRYLNTAGFAIRRSSVNAAEGLFNPAALRSEDTLLLVELIQRGELPFFVPEAVVQHAVSLPLLNCLAKDVRSAWQEGKTFEMIETKGIPVRMSHKERLTMLATTWRIAHRPSIGRTAWLVLVIRQSVQRIVTFCYRCLRIGAGQGVPGTAS